jgi:CRISPR-associated protein Csm4
LDSGTVFGHLCWWVRLREGEEALVRFLAEQEQAPFLVSSGIPSGYLPVPLLKPTSRANSRPEAGSVETRLANLDERKKLKRRLWLSVAAFLAERSALDPTTLAAALLRDKPPVSGQDQRMAHNRIDRLTGTTPKQGGLYFLDEYWSSESKGDLWDIYVRGNWPESRLAEAFDYLGEHGYGRDASLGRGRFSVELDLPAPGLFEYRGNRQLSLSHGVVSGNMTDVRYKVKTTFGKLGSAFAVTGAPNKHPVTLLLPGTTFSGESDGPWGRLLTEMHPLRPEVVQNAYHLAVPFSESEMGADHGR